MTGSRHAVRLARRRTVRILAEDAEMVQLYEIKNYIVTRYIFINALCYFFFFRTRPS